MVWTIIGAMAGAFVVFFALVGIPHLFRSTPVDRVLGLDQGPPRTAVDSTDFQYAVEFAVRTHLLRDVTVELLENGDGVFPRLWAELRAASRSITIVSYFGKPGEVSNTVAGILIDRARAGVAVYWVYDAVGSMALPDSYLDRLRNAGVHVVAFRPVRLYMLDRFNNRTHVRSFVIDGAIGYTGGVGFHDSWLGDGRSPDCWRDVNVRITGAAVTRLQAAFIAHWAEAANELLVDDRLAPAGDSTGSSLDVASPDAVRVSRASVMMSPVTAGTSAAERLFALTIATARRTLWISNAYFVPDVDFVNMLCNAARRGVDLRIITNGRKVDVRLARLAARYRYEKLLEAGVRIFEYEPTVLHSKTFVADGKWCSVGSINFDNRSLSINEEATALVLDEEFGRRLETAFAADLGFSREIRLHEYRMRPLSQRALEFAVDFIWRWL